MTKADYLKSLDYGPPRLALRATPTPTQPNGEWAYALAHAPILDRWGEYPETMRAAWRTRWDARWTAQLALPLAVAGLPIVADLPEMPEPTGAAPERDARPPDVPDPRPLTPAGVKALADATDRPGDKLRAKAARSRAARPDWSLTGGS